MNVSVVRSQNKLPADFNKKPHRERLCRVRELIELVRPTPFPPEHCCSHLSCSWCILFRGGKSWYDMSIYCQLSDNALLVKWYIDIPLVWEKQLNITRNVMLLQYSQLAVSSRLYCSLFPQMSDRIFLECNVSTLGSLSPVSRVTLQLATSEWFHLKGLDFCLPGARSPCTTRCGIFSEAAHWTQTKTERWTNPPACVCTIQNWIQK